MEEKKNLLTYALIGLDGFLATVGFHQAGTYYKVGEWFLGCIICSSLQLFEQINIA